MRVGGTEERPNIAWFTCCLQLVERECVDSSCVRPETALVALTLPSRALPGSEGAQTSGKRRNGYLVLPLYF